MSRSVDLFVDHTDDPHRLLVLLGQSVHQRAVETTEGSWELRLGDELLAQVHRHPYVDDGDLHLTRYPWAVSVRVGHDGSLLEHRATVALRGVADSLRRHDIRVLLTLDLQNRLDLGPPPGAPPAAAAAASGPAADISPAAGASAQPGFANAGVAPAPEDADRRGAAIDDTAGSGAPLSGAKDGAPEDTSGGVGGSDVAGEEAPPGPEDASGGEVATVEKPDDAVAHSGAAPTRKRRR